MFLRLEFEAELHPKLSKSEEGIVAEEPELAPEMETLLRLELETLLPSAEASLDWCSRDNQRRTRIQYTSFCEQRNAMIQL